MYLKGFGNHHQTEAIAGSLPKKQNSPQQCSHGLYAEQLNGTAFTRPRHQNLHSWLYRIMPSVVQQDFTLYKNNLTSPLLSEQPPTPLRWSPYPEQTTNHDFVDGLQHISANETQNIFLYQCNRSMTHRYFSTYDGELLFVPYLGKIKLHTEFGRLEIKPGWIAVIPRGVRFKVELLDSLAAGYLCENSALALTLPSLGPIGANGLANPRHFLYPEAAYEDQSSEVELLCKYKGNLWLAFSNHSPLNVVAWHGTYSPYCYDLSLFNTINTVSFDHPDPSIFTVLTSESPVSGVANLDLVIFPSRWMVAEHTFRPPYFHRNIMSEFMGLIKGKYDAKQKGFAMGGFSIHNCMTAHGPDKASYQQASTKKLEPEYYDNTLAFMFESQDPWNVTESAYKHPARQEDYLSCWKGLEKNFKAPN
ncbi:homogentisate 1,2-dioxygenase [Legionella yabuuchiae]|uniref:homogentisate 1,2-dioxygenase n=1 Tax=Legionella yabuuchiae TaxID=376727 RepID=UPI00105569C0|nr:homogentisate 1,2-dioxygenase [Legionella yabuuchiae]